MTAFNSFWSWFTFQINFKLIVFEIYSCDRGIQIGVNFIFSKDLWNFLTNVLVFLGYQPWGFVNNADLTAKSIEHLPKFKPNISASKDNQVFRGFLKLHNACAGQVGGFFQTINLWDKRRRSRVEKDFFSWNFKDLRPFTCNAYFVGWKKSCFS